MVLFVASRDEEDRGPRVLARRPLAAADIYFEAGFEGGVAVQQYVRAPTSLLAIQVRYVRE